jgi:glycosyltransferase involved in cell wall biosynthesis
MSRLHPPIAYVDGGYAPGGAGYINYHVGWTLEQRMGYQCKIVGRRQRSPFEYPVDYPSVTFRHMLRNIRDCDVFIALPSSQQLGPGIPGRKLMYVQGILYPFLNGFCTHYVYVSTFVRDVYEQFAHFGDTVIPAFVELDRISAGNPWRARPTRKVLVTGKVAFSTIYRRFRDALHEVAPTLEAQLDPLWAATWEITRLQKAMALLVGYRRIPHADILNRLVHYRYVVVLSSCEGFGIVPLEAMASGCAVVAFHAGGGRDYMLPGINCEATRFPDVHQLARSLTYLIDHEDYAEQLAAAGRAKALAFSKQAFQERWYEYFLQHGFGLGWRNVFVFPRYPVLG